MKINNLFQLAIVVFCLNFASCKNKTKDKDKPVVEVTKQDKEEKEISLEKLSGSTQYPEASLQLLEPNSSALNADSNNFKFEVNNYKLGTQTDNTLSSKLANSGKGQHIHFIVDNGPYSAYYEAEFEKELAEGTHHIVAFLSRSYHESVKNKNSFVAKTVQVGSGQKFETNVNFEKPTLIYSRPKGEYSGKDTENLLLDFFLLNVDLSENGYTVKATINGNEFIITEWVPYVIKGLPKGKVSINLQLLDPEGNPVEGAYNEVTRKVTLKE